nr:MAG TPA: hypothetical protein [Caudoviricetes sp.]
MEGASSFQVCKLGCKILISGSALSGSRLPRSLRNVLPHDKFLISRFACISLLALFSFSRFAGCFYAIH